MAYRKWTPSKTAKREFAQKMNEIDDFCREHGIHQSAKSDSYYFTINGKNYRVSNHSVEASNARAFTDSGEQIREKYHPDGREDDVIYIHASKTRIKEIYNNLVAGYELDGRGNIKDTQLEKADPAAEPTVTVVWSESSNLQDGQTMPLSEADKLFAALDAERHAAHGGSYYDKTAFRIDYVMNGEAHSYGGRQDFGDGDDGLIAHIEKYHTYYADNPDWENYLLRNEGKEALDADKAQREMLLNEFVPYLKLHTNLAEMEQAAKAAMQRGEELPPTEAAYYTALQQYVSDCRGALNQGNYELPPVPQLADFDAELQAYKEQVREEIAQEAASAGMTVEEYAANGYEPYAAPEQAQAQEETKMKKIEDFTIRERRAVQNLIATHEELLNTPSDECITYYFGDYGMHFLKDRITEKEFRPAYEAALKDLGQTPQEFEANAEKYALRWHVIEDLQTKMIENKTPNIKEVGVFNVTVNDEEVYKSYSYKDAQRVAAKEALTADNYGKKIKVVTAFAATNANLNSVEFEANPEKYELTDIRQSVSISGESLYRIKALKEFVNETTGVVIEKGQLGGFVQSEKNLSQYGTCWIDDSARVFNNAVVSDNAYVGQEAMIHRNVQISGNAAVLDSAWITDNAIVKDNAQIRDMPLIKDNAVIKGDAIIICDDTIGGNTEISSGIYDGAALTITPVQSQSLQM